MNLQYLWPELATPLRGAGHIKVYGGGGGVIVPAEIELLHSRGVARIFSPEDGQRMGLVGMINSVVKTCDVDLLGSEHGGNVGAEGGGGAAPAARGVEARAHGL